MTLDAPKERRQGEPPATNAPTKTNGKEYAKVKNAPNATDPKSKPSVGGGIRHRRASSSGSFPPRQWALHHEVLVRSLRLRLCPNDIAGEGALAEAPLRLTRKLAHGSDSGSGCRSSSGQGGD